MDLAELGSEDGEEMTKVLEDFGVEGVEEDETFLPTISSRSDLTGLLVDDIWLSGRQGVPAKARKTTFPH